MHELDAPTYRAFRRRLPDVDVAGLAGYRGFGALLDEMDALRDRGVEVSVAGDSHEGAPIVRLSFGPVDAAQVTVVLAGLHAMEWIGVEVCLALAARLRDRPPARRVEMFPLVNPDGYRRAEHDLRRGRHSYVRANARGVDLNRNWPTNWRARLVAPTVLPILGNAGPSPASEPEIQAVLRTVHALTPRVERALSLHSFGRMVLMPYGGRWQAPPQIATLRAHAAAIATALPNYRVRQTARWLPGAFAFGMELDHFDALGALGLLVECSSGGLRWNDPKSWLHPLRWYNPPDLSAEKARLANALEPFVRAE